MDIQTAKAQREQLKEWIERFSDQQLESLYYYAEILDKAFSGRRGPEGKVIAGYLRMETEAAGERTTVSRLPVRWEMYNGLGILHGGVLATFVDNAMGRTLFMLYPGTIRRQVTVDLNIHYLKGAKGRELTARTELIQAGKSLAVLETTVYDENGEPVCKATGTFRIFTESSA